MYPSIKSSDASLLPMGNGLDIKKVSPSVIIKSGLQVSFARPAAILGIKPIPVARSSPSSFHALEADVMHISDKDIESDILKLR
jgi:hypothetical protein